VILALTANGPGEFAGWVRPLLTALYARAPDLDVHVFCVPDDYATGHEADYLRRLFPRASVYPPSAYLRFALGRPVEGVPVHADRVQYLGGDLMHAGRVHDRLGGRATSYKFSRKRDAARFERVFAVDDANRMQLTGWGVPAERIDVVGNLAIDGALAEADGRFGDGEIDAARDGILLFPGSRKNEVAHATPMFVRIAVQIRRRLPGVPIAFARSPFGTDAELEAGLATGGVRTMYGLRATLERDAGGAAVAILAEGERFPLVTAAMRAARAARLAVSIPGTKVIELAALGIPTVTITALNAAELIVINGPLQYAGRLPLIGTVLKRGAVVAVAKRHRWFAQPNIDAGRELHPEMRGTVLPSRVAALVAERYADAAWLAATSADLRALYADHAGAAERMAAALLEDPSG
jgi:lipid A disaccharide synthetase